MPGFGEYADLPGGNDAFIDVRDLIEEASKDMTLGSTISVENFSLMDAMTAIEIMDPRMDSGVTLEPSGTPEAAFDPLTPLLPVEVCWILDRSFACEMGWHSGNALSQTVYTLLYTHELPHMRTDWFHRFTSGTAASERPIQLVTDVLRSAVYALLKSCDLACLEFSKGHLHDMEDFIGEKSEVSLCEDIPLAKVLDMLEASKKWLMSRQAAHLDWRTPLLQRLELRKHILMALSLSLPEESGKVKSHVTSARSLLQSIQSASAPQPKSSSPAYRAFDPAVNRRLVCVMPLRVINLPTQDEAWGHVRGILDGLWEACSLSSRENPLEWQSVLRIRSRSYPSFRSAYVRSVTMGALASQCTLLSRRTSQWLLETYLREFTHIPAGSLDLESPVAGFRSRNSIDQKLSNIASSLKVNTSQLLVNHYKSFSHNRPRQRRILCNSLLDWHRNVAHAAHLSDAISSLDTINLDQKITFRGISSTVQYLRLSVIIEVVFSGLEIDLYAPDELPFIYWYADQCLHQQHDALSDIIHGGREGSTINFLHAELEFITALRYLCLGTLLILVGSPPSPRYTPFREQTNIERRFKWAFHPEYHSPPDATVPDIEEYRQQLVAMRSESEETRRHASKEHFDRAKGELQKLLKRPAADTHSGLCEFDYRKDIRGLLQTSEANIHTFESIIHPERPSSTLVLSWEPRNHSWVPLIVYKI